MKLAPNPRLELTVRDLPFGFKKFLPGRASESPVLSRGGLPSLLEIVRDQRNKDVQRPSDILAGYAR